MPPYASLIGTIPAFSTIRITVHSGARVRCTTVLGDKSLTSRELDDAILKIDQQPAGDDIKKLIILMVFVPMVFPFNYADPNDRVIHFAQGLIEPFEFDRFRESRDIDYFEGLMKGIQPGLIGKDCVRHTRKYKALEISAIESAGAWV